MDGWKEGGSKEMELSERRRKKFPNILNEIVMKVINLCKYNKRKVFVN